MPELPDLTVYLEALQRRIVGQRLERILLKNPFLLRTAEPPLQACEGRTVTALRRLGKRIAIGFEGDLWLVLHLMIAGRLHWYEKNHRGKIRPPLLQLEFSNGTLTLTEAGTKRRASLHVVAGEAQLLDHDRGGLEVFAATPDEFRQRLSITYHTLKRALTDPTLLSGIGNAYSDVIEPPLFCSMRAPARGMSLQHLLPESTCGSLATRIDRVVRLRPNVLKKSVRSVR